MNDVKTILEAFLRFEKEERLFDDTVLGKFHYWNQVRQYLYEALLGHYGLYSYDPLISGEKWDTKKKLAFFKDLVRNEVRLMRSKKKEVVFVCTSRNMNEKGYATDSLIEDYRNSLPAGAYHQVELFNNLTFDPETKYADRYFNQLLIFIQKFSFLLIPLVSKKVDRLLARYADRFGSDVKLDARFTKKMIADFILQYYFFRRVMRKIRPRVVIASQWTTGMYRACNELGIDCVELQHGSFSGNYTLMYDYPEYVEFSGLSSFPKYFFTFGEYWNEITHMPGKKLSMGNSYLTTKSTAAPDTRFDAIVFVSNKDFTPIFLPIVKSCAKKFGSVTFYFKLHSPEYEYLDKIRAELADYKNVEVIYNERTTNELLNVCDAMFTIHSTVLYQALQLGVKAIILKRKYYWISEDALHLEDVFLVNDEKELFDAIEGIYRKGDFKRQPKKEFFKPFDRLGFQAFLERYKQERP
ncbi:MAG TPA: hypothetical protein VFR58_15710 [Flavisolibacter sp.]|nr:hypothetical protein [Flavisolibacter sp.]